MLKAASTLCSLRVAMFGLLIASCLLSGVASGESMQAIAQGKRPNDQRFGPPRTTRGSQFPMQPVTDAASWPKRCEDIRRRILVAAGLHPLPDRTPLDTVLHGKVERDDYTVERVFFESFPGHYVTGSLYRPKGDSPTKRPAVLSPHGHWKEGRFDDLGLEVARQEIQSGAERFEVAARHVIQTRCVQLARMGCVVFAYDMEGYADSVQLDTHTIGPRPSDDDQDGYLLCSPMAELHGQTLFGLQTWNSIRALDFVASLDDVDAQRIAVTGASGGGTQSMILGAIDQRISASMPAVMVSTAMQGGCVCENAQYLRIGQGNVDIAAATAPRPLGLVCANDWTRELEEKGHPELKALYALLGHPENYEAHFHLRFPHNYNAVNRQHMYHFMNRHLRLGLSEPITEREYMPLEVASEASVWTDRYPKPTCDNVGPAHERRVTASWRAATQRSLHKLDEPARRELLSEGIATMVGRTLADVGEVVWKETSRSDSDVASIAAGTLSVKNHGEQLPTLWVRPQEEFNGQTVVWISDGGKGDVFKADGRLAHQLAGLARKGFAVVVIDMFQQGEFLDGDATLETVSLVIEGDGSQPHHHAACYHFGFNPPLLVERVHDVVSVVRFIEQQDQQTPQQIHLVAMGSQAGPIGLVANATLHDHFTKALIDTRDFKFSSLARIDHPMFLPGILRYGGIEKLWDLNLFLGATQVKQSDDVVKVLLSTAGRRKRQQDYQNVGVEDYLPVFRERLAERLTFPDSWRNWRQRHGDHFDKWKAATRHCVKRHLLATPPSVPFEPEFLGIRKRSGYTSHKIAFNLTADSRVLAYLLIPDGDEPLPAVLLLHDHGAEFRIGKEKLVEPWGDESDKPAIARQWVDKVYGGRFLGDHLAKRGYVCLCYDALNWSDRGGAGFSGQQALASNLNHLGMSFAGLIAHEDLRGAEFLAKRPEVDPERVAAMGHSMGSFRTWQVAALSDDISAGICCCWMATIRGLMVPGNNQTKGQSAFTMTHPGLSHHLDYADVASLACPKPMLFFAGEQDPLFPIDSVRKAYAKMHFVWDDRQAVDRLTTTVYPVSHLFNKEMQDEAFDWLDSRFSPTAETQTANGSRD